ncbi:hypothetical protein [Cellulosimicrobium sp. CUA-896]|nr:hypothetical protein [Cellulosimicrobium sp. CUA-896]
MKRTALRRVLVATAAACAVAVPSAALATPAAARPRTPPGA